MKTVTSFILITFFMQLTLSAQHHDHGKNQSAISNVEPQPLLAQALRLKEALTFLGSSLSAQDEKRLAEIKNKPLDQKTINAIQEILDPYCLATVSINPEARVKVDKGMADAKLIQGGWRSFLVKVINDAGSTAQLKAESPNSEIPVYPSWGDEKVKAEDVRTQGQVANRFLEIQMYHNRPMLRHLSGLRLEYAIVQIYSKDSGKREAEIGFNIGQGTQDIGFRNTIPILFNISSSVKVILDVKDDDGSPTMASFLITDGIERIADDSVDLSKTHFPLIAGQKEFYGPQYEKTPAHLRGIYPLPSRRVAAFDEYPDFYFQAQVYRADGEHVYLPPGKYVITLTRGPEYISQTKEVVIPEGLNEHRLSFKLQRWINLSKLKYYSADHHIHGAGCSHYDSPEEGVTPAQMWRQVLGEDLNIGANLAWGPGWYHQKTFFTGKDFEGSTNSNLMHADVEVSGFPSSHAGHIVLLRLKEDDYPNTTKIEQWPTWTLPVLKWAKDQGAIVGYAHSGLGLEPIEPAQNRLPNYIIPKMDGIGANEYVVTVAHNAVDFYSAGNTPITWELNMWYHTLNCGFRTRLSGETDFPCMYDEQVGMARSYFKADALTYENYIEAIKNGRSYISDGASHLVDFSVNNRESGTQNSELKLKENSKLTITAKAFARMPESQSERGATMAIAPLELPPYWHIERARLPKTRNVQVELLVNGIPADTTIIVADGKMNDIKFSYTVKKSCWVALRIFPSAHTNPIFIEVGDKPIRVLSSAEWCRKAVDQCWKNKSPNIRETERAAAEAAYNKARDVYDRIIKESSGD
ncbi:MAG TPA: CehA/McbA family metallohydrolase [Chryseolinea sp.]|nr:CehA/McbA family metallohydrolase [Chryseolinea sp.]